MRRAGTVRSRQPGRSLRRFGLILGAGALAILLVATLHRVRNTGSFPVPSEDILAGLSLPQAHRGHRREPDWVQHRTLPLLLQQVQRLLGRRHGGLSERQENGEWCADFAARAWQKAGAHFTYGHAPGEINDAAVSFYERASPTASGTRRRVDNVASPGDVAV